MIACRTTIGYGAPKKAGTAGCHGSPLGKEEIEGARQKLNWNHAPFEVPQEILSSWRAVGAKGAKEFKAWDERHNKTEPKKKSEFDRTQAGKLPAGVKQVVSELKAKISEGKPKEATRKCSGNVLDALVPVVPELIGGSADLTGSNNTKAKETKPVTPKDFSGNYIYYGVREHGMCAAMNGMTLHGGIIPFGGTFFVFTDYCRPAIRLAALMKQRVVLVMTHDSIGLGEDGPTHQPVEHLAACRAIPNLLVLRPADGVETAESWEIALENTSGPSMLVLTRQNLPTVRTTHTEENLTAKGAYVLSPAKAKEQAVIFATGSEISLALVAQEKLEAADIGTRVVSIPSWELFEKQPEKYRKEVIGPASVRCAVEAAGGFGWERYIGIDGIFVGMKGFGESAPAEQLYEHFGITAENVVAQIKKKLGK